jgi:phosphinothricin acetyltransferase
MVGLVGAERVGTVRIFSRPAADLPDCATPDVADLEIQVDARHRHRGYGTALVKSALESARTQGYAVVGAVIRADNEYMLKLAGKVGFDCCCESDGRQWWEWRP